MTKVIWYCLPSATTPKKGTRNRAYYLSKAFQEMGLQPYVIGASFHPYLMQEMQVSDSLLLDQTEQVPYIWLKTPRYHKNGIKRIIHMFYYAYALWRNEKKIASITQKPDIIIVSSPDSICFPIAAKLAQKYQAKIIFEIRDLWPLTLIQIKKTLRFNPIVLLMQWIEKQVRKKADHVVSVLPNAFSFLKTKGFENDRYTYIPNGFGFDDQSDGSENCSTVIINTINKLKKQNKFIIGYLGTHGVFNALEQLVAAMELLQKRGNGTIHAVLVGDGCHKKQLIEKAKTLGNMTFLDKIPASQSQSFLAMMNVLFIGWHPLPVYDFGISPDKIFQYMLAGKAIIHAVETAHDPTQIAKSAFIVTPNSPPILANKLEEVNQLPQAALDEMGVRGKEYVRAHHDYRQLAKKYAELF